MGVDRHEASTPPVAPELYSNCFHSKRIVLKSNICLRIYFWALFQIVSNIELGIASGFEEFWRMDEWKKRKKEKRMIKDGADIYHNIPDADNLKNIKRMENHWQTFIYLPIEANFYVLRTCFYRLFAFVYGFVQVSYFFLSFSVDGILCILLHSA